MCVITTFRIREADEHCRSDLSQRDAFKEIESVSSVYRLHKEKVM